MNRAVASKCHSFTNAILLSHYIAIESMNLVLERALPTDMKDEGDMFLVSAELNCIGRAFNRKSILAKNEAAFIIFVFYHFIQKATNSRYIFSSISQVHIWSRMKKIGV